MNIADREKFTEVMFENIRDGIVMLDKSFRILAVNSAMGKWIAEPVSEIIGKDCREIFHDKSSICPHCAALNTFETGEPNINTQKGGSADSPSFAELSAYPVKDETGRVIECVVFVQDITDRMLCHDEVLRLYNEVTQTKEYLEGIIENSADAIVTSDLNGIITFMEQGRRADIRVYQGGGARKISPLCT